MTAPPGLFDPGRIGSLTLRNRILGAPMEKNLALPTGAVTQDNDLTQAQAAEAMTHLAFYVGWPNVFSALPVTKEVFEKRPK